MKNFGHEWSAYLDESWLGRAPGTAPLQRRLAHLAAIIGIDLRKTPSSNLIFARSRRVAHLGDDAGTLIELCWPFHEEVLKIVRPSAIICLGVDTGARVRTLLGANQLIGTFQEQNERLWESQAWRAASGLKVFCLTHPSIADWMNPATDPSGMVKRHLYET